ncbi:NAD(P)-dependent oxidoreductase [Actinocrinis sp.]|uniref:NAD(P)-dependent oxidoreductase n=1 Tax=Actinocrinis sp. TaxID=1920516 RepID=UPI002B8F1AA4|nr:NAD(P)H-binding protein [Actinocrinis sp.]HXR74100.1 NAD(P)H-binding protein [Actinocrinis sp.]
MAKLIVFGAGGKAGRRVVAEAVTRGHEVTAVVRDPAKHADLQQAGVRLVAGDVTEAQSVAAAAAGHDAALSTVFRPDADPAEFYTAAAKALAAGLAEAGVERLVTVGVGTALEVAPGVAVHDSAEFPAEYRSFSVGHSSEIAVFDGSGLDWAVVTPPPAVLDDKAERTGNYRSGGTSVLPAQDGDAVFSYADLAVALVDEAADPKHHREVVAVSGV